MTGQFDAELRDRLAALAAAVPVASPLAVDRVTGAPVRSGSSGRRLAFGGLIPLLAIVLVATLAAGLARLGPLAPGATDGNGPVVATVADGLFELSIRSAKARYTPDQPIKVEASLTYRGSGESTIGHAQGAPVAASNPQGPGGPIGFGIVEPVLLEFELGPVWRESCERSTLVAGIPLTASFAKGGSFSGDDPLAELYRTYLADPALRLAHGTWHIYAVAEFSEGGCGGIRHVIRTEITIDVEGEAVSTGIPPEPTVATPTRAPSPSPTLGTGLGSVESTVEDGGFELTVRSAKAIYAEDEPIVVTGSLVYLGPDAAIEIGHDSSGPIMFGVRERIYGAIDLNTVSLLMCGRTTLERDLPYQLPFRKQGGFPGDHPAAESFKAFMLDPVLRLPSGTWHIYAVVDMTPFCAQLSPTAHLEAELTIVVR